jgi:N-acetylmuramate 1-kinase
MPHRHIDTSDARTVALLSFIRAHFPDVPIPAIASSDASARRYWRLRLHNGDTRIIMDAPPPGEDIRPFIDVQERLIVSEVAVPKIFERDIEQGFLVLEDLGDCTFFQWRHGHSIDTVYAQLEAAIRLLALVTKTETTDLPRFDTARLNREMDLFADWYIAQYHATPFNAEQSAQWQRLRDRVSERLQTMPQGFVHRDYHSRNLMVQGERLVTIDFQDALTGPLTYDLVSLLRDSYIDWPDELVHKLQAVFWQECPSDLRETWPLDQLREDFAWVAVQRHLKVLGIFARLSIRDGKHGYLKDLPLTWTHLQKALTQLPELSDLAVLIEPFAPKAQGLTG